MIGGFLSAIAGSGAAVGLAVAGPHGVDWTAVIGFCTILSVGFVGAGAVRSVTKDRREKAEKEAEAKRKDDSKLDRIEVLLAGDEYSDGLVKEFRDFQSFVRHELTTNSGGSLRDEVLKTKATLTGVATDVATIRSRQNTARQLDQTRHDENVTGPAAEVVP